MSADDNDMMLFIELNDGRKPWSKKKAFKNRKQKERPRRKSGRPRPAR